MTDVRLLKPLRFRTIFLSDTHLGFRGARADFLLDFLESVECDELYLVGDILDIWEMRRRGVHWPESHNAVVQNILARARAGTPVTYIPGNHDELMRTYAGTNIEGVEIRLQAIHECADGRRMLVLHGDEFDTVVQCSRLVAMLGSRMYGALIRANHWVNRVRQAFGFPYWSLAAHLKHRVKNAMQYIANYEQALAHEARQQGVDGLVCGHIHHAEIAERHGVLYCNDGDWVESCTALVETADGHLKLLRWSDVRETVKSHAAPLAGEAA
ncbi:UDP-2,3-diacylglucosamine diphosphatase [Spiribacter halobius]|uniref:UDP-2,3-diacylglucosamine hydrolase n=1 Tax=Sediminicurvatus halobius TaxID=2182432 RepID=A0A2U2N4T5_9GAMM|nr:UDP-2,3-diacylglucosamine diphosphatase [Spiribacter halobius]PWG64048.1 UDP-2,3-diacylglucosamine hydrolase [Spiribacter halobius]UEX76897.1 UDP-2,3-diacylglucosamine diphosphatase [Spiribacter halobius]